MNDRSDEEADNLPPADDRNFYKVEKGSKDGTEVERMLYAGSNLRQGHQASATIRLTIRQRTRVLQQWPAIDLAPE